MYILSYWIVFLLLFFHFVLILFFFTLFYFKREIEREAETEEKNEVGEYGSGKGLRGVGGGERR